MDIVRSVRRIDSSVTYVFLRHILRYVFLVRFRVVEVSKALPKARVGPLVLADFVLEAEIGVHCERGPKSISTSR